MKRLMFTAIGLMTMGAIMLFSYGETTVRANTYGVTAYDGKVSKDLTVEMIYVSSTEKLGFFLKDGKGRYLEGYIIKKVSAEETLVGEYELSSAKKFGKGNRLGKTIKISKIGKKSAVIQHNDNGDSVFLSVAPEISSSLAPGACDRYCDVGSSYYNWWTCHACCLISPLC